MDEIIVWIVLLGTLFALGWVVGIAGFVRAGRALERVAQLERRLAGERGGVDAPQEIPAAAAVLVAEPDVLAVAPVAAPVVSDAAAAGAFEARLTMRMGVWLGAAALLLAGIFLVRYAADAGLLGPAVRCGMAGVLGAILLGGGLWARRRSEAAENYVPGALAAGGVASLLAAAYGVGPLYYLVPAPVDFVLLGVAGLVGLAASLRLGALVAAVGLAGAYATPLLAIQPEDPSVPGLFGYLTVVTAAAWAVVRYTAWTWLGWAATMAAAFYVVAGAGELSAADAWSAAAFVPVVAGLALFLLPPAALESVIGRRLVWVNFSVMGLAGLVLCGAVDDWTCRAGVLLLAPLAIQRGAGAVRLDRLPWVAGLLFLLMLLGWALPEWRATGEVLATDGWKVVLPGAWAPQVIQPLLITASVTAFLFAAAGLWFERRAERPVVWAALAAAVPVLTLGVTYAQVRLFQTDLAWAVMALVLAGALVTAARFAVGLQGAGVYAAAAVAALALGCAMLLTDQWLSVAFALFLPPLAWIEGRSGLTALRKVALVVALLVLGRLLFNWFVLQYAFGDWPVLNGLLGAYGVPAVGFGLAAWMFRRRGEDVTTGVLEAGAVALIAALVVGEIHHWATDGRLYEVPNTFLEDGLQVSALGVLAVAVLRISRRVSGPAFRNAWQILGVGALLGAAGLLVFNPGLTNAGVGRLPVLNALLPAYAVPALLAVLAGQQPETSGRAGFLLRLYGVIAGLLWSSLEVRHLFHAQAMAIDRGGFDNSELWGYSGAWLVYGAALLAIGVTASSRQGRLAGLSVIGLVTVKVFLIDMAGLEGLWRVLSFLGLGLMLIGLGAVYRRFVVIPAVAESPK